MSTAKPRSTDTVAWRRRVTAWLAGLVLAVNVLAPLLVNGPAGAMGVNAADPLSGQVVICTPSGMRVVGPDGVARPLADSDSGAGDVQLCAFCLPLVNAGLGALAAADIVLPAPGAAVTATPTPAHAATLCPAAGHRLPEARGPPAA